MLGCATGRMWAPFIKISNKGRGTNWITRYFLLGMHWLEQTSLSASEIFSKEVNQAVEVIELKFRK